MCAIPVFLRNGGQRQAAAAGGASVGHDAAAADLNDALSAGCDLARVTRMMVPVGVQLFQDVIILAPLV